ncbi:MAG: hypothetical protein KGL39_51540 [Patescibacteria group bacterium]|nr:hypothetical protein [Patescibacteria group bacterium]
MAITPVNVTLIARQILPTGSHEGQVAAVPAGAVNFSVSAVMDTTDGLNASNSAGLTIEVSFDNQQTWGQKVTSGWNGGVDPKGIFPYSPLSLGISLASNATHVRFTLSLPQELSIEIDGQFT